MGKVNRIEEKSFENKTWEIALNFLIVKTPNGHRVLYNQLHMQRPFFQTSYIKEEFTSYKVHNIAQLIAT